MKKNLKRGSGNNGGKPDRAYVSKDSKTENITNKDAKHSPADDKMMRAWNTISQNRGADKVKH